jgi:hypothetical protein
LGSDTRRDESTTHNRQGETIIQIHEQHLSI